MAPQIGGRGGDNADKYKNATNVKDLLDMIGKDVHDKVKEEAQTFKQALKGDLKKAARTIPGLNYTADTCALVKQYYTKRLGARGNPCKELSGKEERFSDTLGGQCTNKKIEGNKYNKTTRKDCGACAPYRRLHLCHHNLETIKNTTSTTSDTLLLEVCMAAKYEGNSIETHYTKHEKTNEGTASQLCTVLARSFADIGDIVRGKDLYLGYDDEERKKRKQLDDNLKTIFEKIHSEVTTTNGDIERRYKKDEEDGPNYYKLREDWWTENRETVWKALTCDVKSNAYFHATCNGKEPTKGYCRCDGAKSVNAGKGSGNVNIVRTYFDYVPQYLRWFEEWAEDFCRKKKIKLENLDTQCRKKDKDGKERYCSGNGFDCTKTIYKKGRIVVGYECTSCSVLCRMYEKWIDNQKKEFLKQKEKYADEIKKYTNGAVGRSGSGRQRRGAGVETATNYDGYEKKFYNKLRGSEYGKVDAFLEKLSKENVCKKIKDKKEEIDFTKNVEYDKNKNDEGTFYHSEYCKPCPICGVKKTNNGGSGSGWEKKNDDECKGGKRYEIPEGTEHNVIPVLSFGDNRDQIKSKMEKFCLTQNGKSGKDSSIGSGDCGGNSDPSLCEPWKCYEAQYVQKDENAKEDDDDEEDVKKVKDAGGLCILPNPKKNEKHESAKKSEKEPDEFQKTFNEFFYFWIGRFLNDSMYWRGKVERCLKNKSEKCKKGCKGNCECFLKWITQKQQEWGKIKEQFSKQDFGTQGENGEDKMLGGLMRCPDFVLKQVLKLEDLFENIKSGYGDVKETEGINKILDEEKQKSKTEEAGGGVDDLAAHAALVRQCTAGGVAKQNTTIDKLLNQEKGEADKCKDCQETQPKPTGEDLARADADPSSPPDGPPDGRSDANASEDDDEDDDDDDGEDGQESAEEANGDTTEDTEDQEGETAPPAAPAVQDDVCKTVAELFSSVENLTKACEQKYGKTAPTSWKCIPTGNTSNDNKGESSGKGDRSKRHTSDASDTTRDSDTTGKSGGSICVPPRRRKLYVGKLEQWVDKVANTQASVSSQAGSESQGGGQAQAQARDKATEDLRDAFIESAAIETFFLWHKYKAENTKKTDATLGGGSPLLPQSPVPVSNSGEQNPQNQLANGTIPNDFLRLMFYTLGDYRDICIGKTPNGIDKVSASGDNKSGNNIKEISEKIKKTLNGDNKQQPDKQNNDEQRNKWWNEHAPSIWEGMICALTYKDPDTEEKGGTPQKVQAADDKDLFDTLKKKYEYGSVTISSVPSGENTPTLLSNFVKRPPYFRYLEEWGETFCRQRKKKLEKIKDDCKVDKDGKNGNKKCSGYGEDCEDNLSKNTYDTVPSLLCPGCGIECRKYKQWIETKRKEFDEQEKAYVEQKKFAEGNNGGNGFCGTLETNCTDAASFLNRLKSGPCKKDDDNNDNGEDEIDFKEKDGKTFKHTKHCDPCSQFKIDCQKGNCRSGDTKVRCQNNKISADDIKNEDNFTDTIDMLVSDNSPNGFENGLEACGSANIFKGIRKEEWKCRNECGYVVCKSENVKGQKVIEKKDNGEKHIITIRALVTHWVQYFLEDYNKIRRKLNPCRNNGEGYQCIKDCVEKWIKEKREEWRKIKEPYLQQYKNNDQGDYPVTTILEDFESRTELNEAIKPCGLTHFKTSCGLNGAENSQKKDGTPKDVVECLLQKLETKAKKCEEKHQASVENQAQTCEKSTPSVENDEEPLEEENPVDPPKICPKPKETKEKEDEKCGEPEPPPKERAPPSEETNQNPPIKPEDEATEPKKPTPEKEEKVSPPSNVFDNPHVKTALVTSTLAWSVGIGFAAFTYFYLKVLYIYMYMWMCFFYMYLWVFLDIYVCICGCICVLYIYIYVYVFVYMYVLVYIGVFSSFFFFVDNVKLNILSP
ncbi:hypothetical protein PFTANZ_06418 [Plasmodium falciparum Tanzania (2000708)]|uniref:Duffy-binding-like domain-containing protein n=1 Tax=Plasmodium falciparum Tanzania (2000708) TaxID=1036725 RepID=A0A024VXA4_PLAFA|nr:hypothetical protein PFTANZ_06418 [Plasmodium falciparum Tanzania (2000708)]